jgi:hypothetical protein
MIRIRKIQIVLLVCESDKEIIGQNSIRDT